MLTAAFADLLPFVAWGVPMIGVAAAGLTFLVGRAVLSRRQATGAPTKGPATAAPSLPADDPFVFGSTFERRTAARREGNPVEVTIADPAGGEPLHGWVLDRSVGGLGLRMEVAVPVGMVLNVRPRKAPKLVPWTELEVKSCRQNGTTWEVGCQFVQTPPWSVLVLFG
jgi:hypothetical protein